MRIEKILEYKVFQMLYNSYIIYVASTVVGIAIAALSPIARSPALKLLGPVILILGLLIYLKRVSVVAKYLEILSKRSGLAYVDVNRVRARRAYRVFLSLGPSYAPNIISADVDPRYVTALVFVKPVLTRLNYVRKSIVVQGFVIGCLAGLILLMLGDTTLAILIPIIQTSSTIIAAKRFQTRSLA